MKPFSGPATFFTGRRRDSRLRLGVPGTVLLIAGKEKVLVDDLSVSGARVTLNCPLPHPGSGVILTTCGLEIFGTVVWAIGQRFGMRFEDMLTRDQIVAARHYADHYNEIERKAQERNAREFVQGRKRIA